jgi:TonB family protein
VTHGVVTLGLSDPGTAPAPDDQDPGPISGPSRPPGSRPGGLAVSGILHVLAVFLVVQAAIAHAPEAPRPAIARGPSPKAVFLPPPAAVRKMLGLPPPPAPRPPEPSAKDRISIGAPSRLQARERIELRRDDDLTAVPKGTPNVGTPAAAAPPPPALRPPGAATAMDGRLAAKPERPSLAPGPILASLRRLEAAGAAGEPAPLGATTGTGGEMGALSFDPQGADFTEWVQRFKNEVYRNWIVPPAAALGWGGGEVAFQFVVDRRGAVTEVGLVSSSGIGAYDRAARNALVSSRLLPLPADYAPPTLTINVVFSYGPPRPAEGAHSGR